MRLVGKRAIVTGSSSGIGRAIAVLLAAEGAQVVVNARGAGAVEAVVDEIGQAGGKASGFPGAVDDPDVAQALVAHCVSAFGGIDILINNAGVYSDAKVDQCSLDEWRELLRINLEGPFLLSRAALPHMRAQRWGRIINASSSAAFGNMGTSAYAASKSALFGLTRAIAVDYGPYGITANCYNPEARGVMGGISDQAHFDRVLRHYQERGYCTDVEIRNLAAIGGPDGVAPWIAYLCTDQAASLNGQIFAVEARRVGLIAPLQETRVLYKDTQRDGPFLLEELERMAPFVFPLTNPWPPLEGPALEAWEQA